MRRILTICILAASVLLLDTPGEALAKGKRGGGGVRRGGGHGSVHRKSPARGVHQTSDHVRGTRPHDHDFRGRTRTDGAPGSLTQDGNSRGLYGGRDRATQHDHFARDHSLTEGEPSTVRQRFNEERKLQHRQNVANQLRGIGERNGNQNLLDTADRMDQNAQRHYEKRMGAINEKAGLTEPGDPADPGETLPGTDPASLDNAPHPVDEPPSVFDEPGDSEHGFVPDGSELHDHGKLYGRQNALDRQYHNAERQLEHHLQRSRVYRDAYDQTGDPVMLQTAEQIEQLAIDRYVQQMGQINNFADRFRLTLPGTVITVP